jgi:hypothetical protein
MKKFIIAGLLIASVATPALAAKKTYYIESSKTHKCMVTSKKPASGMMIGTSTYDSKSAAKKAMKAMPDCKA